MEKAPTSSDPPSFEKVWLLIQETQKLIQETDRKIKETDRQIKETDRQIKETNRQIQETDRQIQETDRQLKQQLKETDRQLKETDQQLKETDRQLKETIQTLNRYIQENDRRSKETDKKLRKLESLFIGQWGKLVESLVSGDLIQLLKNYGLDVYETYERQKRIYKDKPIEIDIIAANGQDVVAVEVKTTLRVDDVRNFIEKLEILRDAFPRYQNNNIYGAIAFLRVEQGADTYAMREGLFVIRATGKSASIINDKNFKPRRF